MQKLRLLTIVAMAFGLLAGASAETVESTFGSPVSKKAAVGDPPISRWEYPTMTVYFEYDRVIHAVVKR
jgi:hypothetical protein